MIFTVAHSDFDGLLSTSIVLKFFSNSLNFFSSSNSLKKVLCKIIAFRDDLEKIFILDISPKEITLKLSSIFKEAIWIDHHILETENKYENVKIFIDSNYKSCASLVAKYFNFESEWIEIANKIDSNSCDDEISKIIRAYSNYLRNKKLLPVFRILSRKILDYNPKKFAESVKEIAISFENEMREKKKNAKKSIFKIKDYTITFFELEESIPPYILVENENSDLIIISYKDKVEFRSNKIDVEKIARAFNGGGHKNASGAIIKSLKKEEFIKKLEELLQ